MEGEYFEFRTATGRLVLLSKRDQEICDLVAKYPKNTLKQLVLKKTGLDKIPHRDDSFIKIWNQMRHDIHFLTSGGLLSKTSENDSDDGLADFVYDFTKLGNEVYQAFLVANKTNTHFP